MVNGLMLEYTCPMIGELRGDDVGGSAMLARLELDGTNGVAVAWPEAADGTKDVVAASGGAVVVVTLVGGLDIPHLLQDVLFGQLGGVVLEGMEPSGVGGIGIGGVDQGGDVWVLQGLAAGFTEIPLLDGADAGERAVEFFLRGVGYVVEAFRDHVAGDRVHGAFKEDHAPGGVAEILG